MVLKKVLESPWIWSSWKSGNPVFNQFTSLLALNCSCPNFFWNVLQVWMTGKDVYLQMTWSWPDKTWNILCSYCLQWNTSQSKFRNHYFLFLFAFSILSQLFLIWGCTLYKKKCLHIYIYIYIYIYINAFIWSVYNFCIYISFLVSIWIANISCRGEEYIYIYIEREREREREIYT